MHGACTEHASIRTDTHSFKRKSLIGSICIKFKLSWPSDMHSAQKIIKKTHFFPIIPHFWSRFGNFFIKLDALARSLEH